MEAALGRLLRDWRVARQISLEQLAARAGVVKSTVSTWETGTHRPRLVELTAVLAALGVSAAQREQALALIRAPRAIRQLRGELAGAGGAGRGAGPGAVSGELLRAMRGRRRLTLEQVAAGLGVRPSTICRWERGESSPLPERRDALFELLGAQPAERAALAEGHWIVPPHGEAALEELEAELAALRARISSGDRALMDLQLLALAARLWKPARAHAGARSLLTQLWSEYAAWLSWDDRKPEAARCAERVLERVREEPEWGRCQPDATFRALQVAALIVGHRPVPRAPLRAVELLREWLPMTAAPQWRAEVCRDMADHAARGGEHAAALAFSRQALQAAGATGEAETERLCRHVHADVLLRAGRPGEACAFLAADSDTYPIRRILETLQRATVLLALRERAAAHAALNHAYALIDTYQYPNFRQSADALAARF